MSYGPDIATLVRGAARYVDRVLRGEKAADAGARADTAAAYNQPQNRQLINLKTASELGVTVPPALLARADEVIE
jgi:putative ABC transport system substrate-binding protein